MRPPGVVANDDAEHAETPAVHHQEHFTSLFSDGYGRQTVGQTLHGQVSNPPVARRRAIREHHRGSSGNPARGDGGVALAQAQQHLPLVIARYHP